MSDLIKKEDAIDAIGADIDEIDALDPSAGIKKACIRRAIWKVMGVPPADRPRDDCTTCEHYNDVGDWCKTCGVSHYTPRMKGADDE